MNPSVRTYQLAKILIISQLRAGRSKSGKARIWERPAFILGADALALSLSWLVTFEILSLMPAEYDSLIEITARQVLAFVPVFALAIVLLAGIMFELSASSRFASSDLVNWLPISKSEYVAASAISVSYIYSIYFCIAAGITLALSFETHLIFAWIVSFALSIAALLTGGFLIEILRASINRVYTVMSKKTGRATLIIRLALTIVIIVAFQVVFYPNLLFGIMNQFVGALDAAFFVPLVWPALTVLAVMVGDLARAIIFGSLTVVFVVLIFLIAVVVRSKYWTTSPAAMTFESKRGYTPRHSWLGSLGFSNVEASIISKDLKGYVRQKELLGFLAMPFVFAAIIVIQGITVTTGGGPSYISWLVAWFAGFSAIFVSSSSIGTEAKSIMNLYVVPLDAKELVRAKVSSSLVISLAGALTMSLVATVFFSESLGFFLKLLVMSVLTSTQSVFVGLCFATRYSDFAERPRPRFVTISGMLYAMVVGTAALLITSSPILLLFESQPYLSVLISFVLFSFISVIAYRYSLRGARAFLTEMKI